MTRFKVLSGVGLVLALLLAGSVWIAQAMGVASVVQRTVGPPTQISFNITNTYVSGSPAIQPRTSTKTSGASFTNDDVVAFLNKYNGRGFSGPLVQGAHLKIVTIQFVTAKRASELMQGESVGRPDDYLVCYLKIEGPFLLTDVHQPRGSGLPNKVEFNDAVFDAHTGNLLVWGALY